MDADDGEVAGGLDTHADGIELVDCHADVARRSDFAGELQRQPLG